jgi:putative DNA primase/helicase
MKTLMRFDLDTDERVPVGALPLGLKPAHSGIELSEPEGSTTWLCSPLAVISTFRDVLGSGWGRLVAVTDEDGIVHHLPFNDSDITTKWNSVLRSLVGAGLRVSPDPASKKALQRLLLEWRPERRQTSTSTVGWVGRDHKAFVLGSGKVIGDLDVLPVHLSTSPSAAAQTEKGELSEWTAEVGSLCSGNDILMLAVSTALSGPMLDFLDLDLGGGLHLKGASSQGKSTALRVATSVWGSPQATCSWRATGNGLEALAASVSGTLLPLDELGEVEGRHLNDILYALANGVGKTRMTSSNDPAKTKRWRMSILSTGEISVARKLAEAAKKQMPGQMVRLLDITADGQRYGAFDELHGAVDAAAFADRLKLATIRFHGTAGVAFVRGLIARADQREKIRTMVSSWAAVFCSHVPAAPSGIIQRAAERFALIGVSGELATNFGITGWKKGASVDTAMRAFIAWHEGVNDAAAEALAPILSVVKNFYQDRAAEIHRFDVVPSGEDEAPAAWEDDRFLYTPSATWSSLFPDASGRTAAVALREAGVLLPGEVENLMRKATDPQGRRLRYYTLIKQQVGLENQG